MRGSCFAFGFLVTIAWCVLDVTGATGPQVPPEVRVSDYLLKRPTGLSKLLGKVTKRTECADTDGRQIEYERGYACVAGGRVVLLGYELRRRVTTPEEALRSVGPVSCHG